jgi:hypothetical protein
LETDAITEDVVHFVRLKFTEATNTFDLYYDDMTIPVDTGSFAGDVDFSSIDDATMVIGGQTVGGPIALDGSIGNLGIYSDSQDDDYFEDIYNLGDVYPLDIRLNTLANFAVTGIELGGTTDNNQPELTFDLTSDNTSLQLHYGLQVARDDAFTDVVIDYTSGLVDQGEVSFTVGQAEGDGEYDEAGVLDQELEDGSYYVRAVSFVEDIFGEIVVVNEGDVAFTVDTTVPEVSSSSSSKTGSVSKRVVAKSNTPVNYNEEVERVLDEKVVEENPTNETNKCEALTMMARVFEWEFDDEAKSDFGDVPDWCVAVANFATDRGIVEGRTETLLGLDSPVTRDEIAMMLFRELVEQEYSFSGDLDIVFTDVLTDWAEEAIMKLAKEGFVKGYEDGSFGGADSILKQDLGVMLLRVKRVL